MHVLYYTFNGYFRVTPTYKENFYCKTVCHVIPEQSYTSHVYRLPCLHQEAMWND
jgi:hypothetical protein